MRILIVSNLYPPDVIGGYELGCKMIADALVARGHHVTVATSEVRNLKRSDRGEATPESGAVCVRRIFLPLWEYEMSDTLNSKLPYRTAKLQRQVLCDPASAMALSMVIETEKFDVIYAFNLFGIGLLGLFETLLAPGVPVVVHLMDDIDAFVTKFIKSPGLLARFGMLKRHVTAIACSEGTRVRNGRMGPYGSSHVIYSGISSESHRVRPVMVRKDVGEVFRFVYTGQVTEGKGLRQLVAAFRQVVSEQKNRQLELHIIGAYANGFDKELLGTQDIRKNEAGIVFHGYKNRADLLSAISGMDLGVYPLPKNEAFGYAPMECLACGVPAVITEGGGFWEILPGNYPLCVSDRDSIDELANTMTRGMLDAPAAEYAMKCFELVELQYDFASYGITSIERVLREASRSPITWNFQESLQRQRTFRDYAQVYPERVFNMSEFS